jgi:hypothetical protein
MQFNIHSDEQNQVNSTYASLKLRISDYLSWVWLEVFIFAYVRLFIIIVLALNRF